MRWVALCLAVGCGRYDFEPTNSDCWPGRRRDAPYNALGSCVTVGTAMPPSAFFSRANDPLTRWDFTTIWQEVAAGYPQLRAP